MPTVPPSGPSPADIVVLGEAPGVQEVRQGRGWVGKAGQELWHVLEPLGLSRQSVRVANVMWDRPPENRDPLPDEVARWRGPLLDDLRQARVRLVVACGRFAAEWCLGRPSRLDRDAGLLFACPDLPAEACLVAVHPAAALHSPEIYTAFWLSLQPLRTLAPGGRLGPDLAARVLQDAVPAPTYTQSLREGPSAALSGHPRTALGVDTEGSLESPLGASWSLRAGMGVWDHEWGLPAEVEGWPVVLHNAAHDLPVLERLGSPVRPSQCEDTMVMAHVLGEGRVGLKIQAWRQCGMVLRDYEDVTAEARDRLARDYLARVLQTYVPQWQERISEKTGKRLKPRRKAPLPVYQAASRCLAHEAPARLWRDQAAERHDEAYALVGEVMPEAGLEHVG